MSNTTYNSTLTPTEYTHKIDGFVNFFSRLLISQPQLNNLPLPYPVTQQKISYVCDTVLQEIKQFNNSVTDQNASHLIDVLKKNSDKVQIFRKKDSKKLYLDKLDSISQHFRTLTTSLQEMQKTGGFYPIFLEEKKSFTEAFIDRSVSFIKKIDSYFQGPFGVNGQTITKSNYFNMIVTEGNEDIEVYARTAQSYVAITDLSELIDNGTESASLYVSRAEAYMVVSEVANALRDAQMAIKLAPTDGLIFFRVGIIYSRSKKLDVAQECFNKALSFNYATAAVYYEKALVDGELGLSEQSYNGLIHANRIDPSYSTQDLYHSYKGRLEAGLGKTGEAISSFVKAIEFTNPSDTQALVTLKFFISQVYILRDQFEEAKTHIDTAIQLNERAKVRDAKFYVLKVLVDFILNPEAFEKIQMDFKAQLGS